MSSTPDPNAGRRPAREKDDPAWAPESGDKPDAAEPTAPSPSPQRRDDDDPQRTTPGGPSRGSPR